MPVIKVTLIEGYDDATRIRIAERLTDAVRSVIAAPLDGVTVAIEEVASAGYMRGRTSKVPGAPLPDPETLVRNFLTAMARRDLEAARRFLDKDFTMTFPGGHRFTTLEALVEWAGRRYRSVDKSYVGFDVVPGRDGVVVYCFGTLDGIWLDGTGFSGIRFIDRFVVCDGKLAEQTVWNDLGEVVGTRAHDAGG
ncbi:MAG: tautomerase family protein [Pseudomonadota bacterium]